MKQLRAEDAKESLAAHASAKGEEIHARYPVLGWAELSRLLQDRVCVRYPCEIKFDASSLQPGECIFPMAQGEKPEDGYVLHVHPRFMARLEEVVPLVLYQLVLVNYGPFASAEDAEFFGSAALGISREEYYEMLCQLHDGC